MTQNQLLKSIAHKPEETFRNLVSDHKEELYWYIRRMVIRHADADDILQNTFMKAWKGISSFKGKSSISTWLFAIARNETFSFLKKNERYIHSEVSIDQTLAGEKASGYFDGESAEKILQEAVAYLPERQKEIFILKYYQEKSYNEIVDIVGGSVGSHKASYHHAHNKVKEFLKARLNQIIEP